MNQIQEKKESMLARFWPALLIGVAWIWVFWPMMIGKEVVGFRDSAYLYYPLFKWIDAQWAAGQIPLWNPYCNFGMPVVADGTSSVFYPGKAVFFCRFLSYPARYGIYIAMHVPLAAAGAYWFARTLRANRAGATLAAISFAFGGSVLFQVTNVVFLVSAAWLPIAACCVWKMVKTGQVRWSIGAGVCCALMILGGDPQMVYHVGLIAVGTIFGEFLRKKRRRLRVKKECQTSPYSWLVFRAAPRLILMIVITSLLAAIQLLPTYVWSRQSERTNPEFPANIYQAAIHPGRLGLPNGMNSLIGEPVGTIDHSYQFSQPPWSMAELIWPNVAGKPFPLYQRWSSALPGADRMWVPSLYAGLATLLIGITGIRFWGRSRTRIWLTWLMVFFAIASFGWYGLVWLASEIAPTAMENYQIGPQVGGLYWLMNMLLPEYFAFRYPAKLFVVASLGLSLLAGVNLRKSTMKIVSVVAAICAVVSFNAIIMVLRFGDLWLSGIPADDMFGPFDSAGAIGALKITFLHTTVVSLGLFSLAISIIYANINRRHVLTVALVLLLTVELMYANSWMTSQVPAAVFEEPTEVENRIKELKESIAGSEPLRIYRTPNGGVHLVQWSAATSDDRLSEVITWQRETLYPKQHLGLDVALLGSFSSIWPSSYEKFFYEIELQYGWGWRKNRNSNLPTRKVFHAFVGLTEIEDFIPSKSYDLTCPVEWMFEYDPLTETEKSQQPPDCIWNRPFEQTVANVGDQKNCEITEFGTSRFVARVSTDSPKMLGFLTVPDLGWKAKVRRITEDQHSVSSQYDVKFVRSRDWNRAFDTMDVQWVEYNYDDLLLLPFDEPGTYEVEFAYSPIEFWIGMWISIGSWLVLPIWPLMSSIGRIRNRNALVDSA